MPIVFEKARLNVFNLAGFIVVVVINLVGGAIIWTNLTRDVAEIRQSQISRAMVSDKNFDDLRTQVAPVPQMKFQQDLQAKQIDELTKQLNGLIDRVGAKLDTLNENVNNIRTEVRVLAQEVRSNAEKAKPTSFAP